MDDNKLKSEIEEVRRFQNELIKAAQRGQARLDALLSEANVEIPEPARQATLIECNRKAMESDRKNLAENETALARAKQALNGAFGQTPRKQTRRERKDLRAGASA